MSSRAVTTTIVGLASRSASFSITSKPEPPGRPRSSSIRSMPSAAATAQVRAVPDERTIRYYAAIGLLDRPAAMRGRTAIYGARHLAQVVAIKRLQAAGRSLAEIQALWPTLDDHTLARMSGIAIA